IILPKSISEAVDSAEVFSSEENENYVTIELVKGSVRITGKGVTGKHQEVKKMPSYDGPNKTFHVIPQLIIELVKRHNEVTISDSQLLVNGGKWMYAVYLEKVEDEK